ncbi:hypothetical protein [Epilithonimonas tenax]|uniref:hypothetical protein n=1 Tax=Epilithonimonas tenax TaxID=191577 RepID=UPI00047F8AFF|nr:hypothetical protein [Epilithonimonas tenax]
MRNILISISLIVLIILLAFIFFKKDYQVINAKFNSGNNNFYPPDCYIKFENKNFLTTNRWIYKWNILIKRIVPASESILVYRFNIFENHYSLDEKGFTFLKLLEIKDSVEYNGNAYKIDFRKGDSLFSKINDNEIIIFINSKNLD